MTSSWWRCGHLSCQRWDGVTNPDSSRVYRPQDREIVRPGQRYCLRQLDRAGAGGDCHNEHLRRSCRRFRQASDMAGVRRPNQRYRSGQMTPYIGGARAAPRQSRSIKSPSGSGSRHEACLLYRVELIAPYSRRGSRVRTRRGPRSLCSMAPRRQPFFLDQLQPIAHQRRVASETQSLIRPSTAVLPAVAAPRVWLHEPATPRAYSSPDYM